MKLSHLSLKHAFTVENEVLTFLSSIPEWKLFYTYCPENKTSVGFGLLSKTKYIIIEAWDLIKEKLLPYIPMQDESILNCVVNLYHRIVWVGMDLTGHQVQLPYSKQGHWQLDYEQKKPDTKFFCPYPVLKTFRTEGRPMARCDCFPNAGILWKNCHSATFIQLEMQSHSYTSHFSNNCWSRKSQNFSNLSHFKRNKPWKMYIRTEIYQNTRDFFLLHG